MVFQPNNIRAATTCGRTATWDYAKGEWVEGEQQRESRGDWVDGQWVKRRYRGGGGGKRPVTVERQKVLDADAAERVARAVEQCAAAEQERAERKHQDELLRAEWRRGRAVEPDADYIEHCAAAEQYRAAEERKDALIGLKDLAAYSDPWSRCMLAAACCGTRRLVERFLRKQKASTATYHSDQALRRLNQAQLFGCSRWVPETSLSLGGTGLVVTDVGSLVTGDGAGRVRRVVEMPREFQRAVECITEDVQGFFLVAERQRVDHGELWGNQMRPHVGRDRAPTWSQNLTDRGQQQCHHADYINSVEAAQGLRHGR